MDKLIAELQSLKDNQREILKWMSNVQERIPNLNKAEQPYYYLLLAELYATKLRDVNMAYEFLKKVKSEKELVNFQHRLRLCYLQYLEGNYEDASHELRFIISASNYPLPKKIATDFFRRIFHKVEGRKTREQQYEELFLRVIQLSHENSLSEAKAILVRIYRSFSDIHEMVQYQAAKHIILLIEQMGTKQDVKEYKFRVDTEERKLENVGYYKAKIQFLTKVHQFLEVQELYLDKSEPSYEYARVLMILKLKKAMFKAQRNRLRQQVTTFKETLKKLDDQSPEICSLCYKYVGDKAYERFKYQIQLIVNIMQKAQRSVLKQLWEKILPKKGSKFKSAIREKMIKNTRSQMLSQFEENESFVGSKMIKINTNSNGYEQRYFYVKKDFSTTFKLYYCSKLGKQSDDDNYYKLKGFKRIVFGKQTKALRRQECDDFPEDQCFTLKITEGQEKVERNFYVKDPEDFERWVELLEKLLPKKEQNGRKPKPSKVVIEL